VPVTDARGISLDYRMDGDPSGPAVLLVMGLGMPAAMWPDDFVDALIGRGFHVVQFDNRDCGGSSRLTGQPVPNIPAAIARALLRLKVRAPYDLGDMARDAIAVLDAAGIERAHVVGVSMGGMIAQVLAATYPTRVKSLTSIMSSSGNPRPSIALGKRRALRALLLRPPNDPADIEGIVDHLVHVFGVIGSPGYPQTAETLRPHLARVAKRGLYPAGTSRQLAAILASGDRREMLRGIDTPTLVIHGADDPLVPVAAGRDTASHIRGARLDVIAGMGHDFPPALMTRIAHDVAEHCIRVERSVTPVAAPVAPIEPVKPVEPVEPVQPVAPVTAESAATAPDTVAPAATASEHSPAAPVAAGSVPATAQPVMPADVAPGIAGAAQAPAATPVVAGDTTGKETMQPT
jgi:pimeloyl-ACP methyl ester carboxylesterase